MTLLGLDRSRLENRCLEKILLQPVAKGPLGSVNSRADMMPSKPQACPRARWPQISSITRQETCRQGRVTPRTLYGCLGPRADILPATQCANASGASP